MFDLVFRGRRVITPEGEAARCVGVRDGRIAAVEPFEAEMDAAWVVDLREDMALLPGLVDTHVHINEPGRTEWEGFGPATRAAAAGGITTIVDMPLNSVPPTVDVAALEVKRKAARGKVYVDVGFWGGAVPGNAGDRRGLYDAGVFGFKCFMLHSGVDEFDYLRPHDLADALHQLSGLGAMMIVHAEDAGTIAYCASAEESTSARDHAPGAHGRRYADFLASRPRGAENLAVARVTEFARWTGARVHILHLSSSDTLPMIASARRDGVAITAETCPHYLTFTAEEIPDGATQFKCCPPIREADNQERLWRGLAEGVIDCVVSDHSPCTAELKRLDTGDFALAWGGIAGLQVGLPAVWTQARRRGHRLTDVARWMATRPAELVGLRRKGKIAVGYDADLCALAPEEEFTVDAGTLHHRNPVSAYHGRTLTGVVRGAWLRGRAVGAGPYGALISRGEA